MRRGSRRPPRRNSVRLSLKSRRYISPPQKTKKVLSMRTTVWRRISRPSVPSAETVAAPPPVREEEPKKLEPWKAADAGVKMISLEDLEGSMAQAATQNPVPSIPASMMPMQVGGPVRPPPVQHHQQQPGCSCFGGARGEVPARTLTTTPALVLA